MEVRAGTRFFVISDLECSYVLWFWEFVTLFLSMSTCIFVWRMEALEIVFYVRVSYLKFLVWYLVSVWLGKLWLFVSLNYSAHIVLWEASYDWLLCKDSCRVFLSETLVDLLKYDVAWKRITLNLVWVYLTLLVPCLQSCLRKLCHQRQNAALRFLRRGDGE